VRPILILICLALVLGLAQPALAQDQTLARGSIWALGSASLTQEGGPASAQETATTCALRSAVAQALAKTLGLRRIESALTLVAEPILANPHPYVLGFQIKARTETQDRLYLLVLAQINLAQLKTALSGLGLGRVLKARLLPLVSLTINSSEPYAWWQTPDQSPPISLALSALVKQLGNLGCEILPTPQEPPQPLSLRPSPQEAAALGRHFQAELVLLGHIEEEDGPEGRMAQMTCQIVAVDSGQVVAGPITFGQPSPPLSAEEALLMMETGLSELPADQPQERPEDQEAGPQPPPEAAFPTTETPPSPPVNQPQGPEQAEPEPAAAPSSPWSAAQGPRLDQLQGPLKTDEAGERMAALLVNQLRQAGWVLAAKPTEVKIQVFGIKRFADMRYFLDALSRLPEQVQDVKQQSIRAGQATFKATLLTTTRNLADLLLAQDYPTFFVSVVEVSPEELQIKLIAK